MNQNWPSTSAKQCSRVRRRFADGDLPAPASGGLNLPECKCTDSTCVERRPPVASALHLASWVHQMAMLLHGGRHHTADAVRKMAHRSLCRFGYRAGRRHTGGPLQAAAPAKQEARQAPPQAGRRGRHTGAHTLRHLCICCRSHALPPLLQEALFQPTCW